MYVFILDNGVIVSFRQYVQQAQTGLNALQVKCRDLDLDISVHKLWVEGIENDAASWGSWSDECPLGMGVAAAEMIYQPHAGTWYDDSGAGGLNMFCSGF